MASAKRADVKRFIEIVPIAYSGSLGTIKTEDYFYMPIDVMKRSGFKCELVSNCEYGVFSMKRKDDYFPKDVPILGRMKMREYIRYLRKNKDSLIFSNDRTLRSFLPGILCRKTVFMSHQSTLPKERWKREAFRFFVRKFKAIKVSNPFEAAELVKIGVKKDRIHYIPIAIDHEFFSRKIQESEKESLRKKYNIRKGEKVIVFLAFVRKFKNPYTIIRALRELNEHGTKTKLVVIGKDLLDEEGGPDLKEFAEQEGVSDKVILTGPLHPSETLRIFSIADVGVLSSYHEGQCLVAYEMASAGLPLCLSDIGSFNSVFMKSALFHEPDDHKALASNIKRCFKDRELVDAYTKINAELVKERCDHAVVERKLKALFVSVYGAQNV